jgi:hypothetical protein
MLSHEDDGMMGQFIVFDNISTTDELGMETISIFPNPTTNLITINGLHKATIELYNTSGQLLSIKEEASDVEQFNMSQYPVGVYYFNIKSASINKAYKVIKQ